MRSLYDEVLDVGDRLAAALTVGDLTLAASTLGERARLVDALSTATDRPSPEHVARFQAQDAVLGRVLRGGLRSLASATGRASAAADAYQARPAAPARLDTARR